MVRDRDSSLLDLIAYELDLVLHLQLVCLFAFMLDLACEVPDTKLDCSWETLLSILAQVLEKDSLLAIPVRWVRSVESSLPPSLWTTV